MITHYIFDGAITGEDLDTITSMTSWNGQSHTFHDGRMMDENVTIEKKDAYIAPDGSGIIHFIDAYIVPSWVHVTMEQRIQRDFPEWYALLQRANMTDSLQGVGPKTILIPQKSVLLDALVDGGRLDVDDDASLQRLLQYHFLPDFNFFVSQAAMIEHEVIDDMILTNRWIPIPTAAEVSSVNATITGECSDFFNRQATIDGINVVQNDLYVNNGVIQILEDILVLGKQRAARRRHLQAPTVANETLYKEYCTDHNNIDRRRRVRRQLIEKSSSLLRAVG